jgi:hypothetical protein
MSYSIFTGNLEREDRLTEQNTKSFLGTINTYQMPKGTILWRFVSLQSRKLFSDCWVDPQTMSQIMNTLHLNGNFTLEYKRWAIRNSLAILDDWSSVNWRVQIELMKPVIAHVGFAAAQKGYKETNRQFAFAGGQVHKLDDSKPSGLTQHIIPRFKGLDDNNDFARVLSKVHI